MKKEKEEKDCQVYSVSQKDMMDIWIESFHPDETVLVIWDVQNHYDILAECGILLNKAVTYNSKVITMGFENAGRAYKIQDQIIMAGCMAYMQVYKGGKLVSDNI